MMEVTAVTRHAKPYPYHHQRNKIRVYLQSGCCSCCQTNSVRLLTVLNLEPAWNLLLLASLVALPSWTCFPESLKCAILLHIVEVYLAIITFCVCVCMLKQQVGAVPHCQQQQPHIHLSQPNINVAYRGRSLPNVNQMSSSSGIDLQVMYIVHSKIFIISTFMSVLTRSRQINWFSAWYQVQSSRPNIQPYLHGGP